MTLRVGMIGMGVISKYYVHAMQNRPDTPELAAVCDLNEERMKPFAESGTPCFTDYHELLRQADIDAVIVNVPNDKHYAICMDALLAGKHVCCEKPMTLTLREAGELVALSRKTGITLFTAFHRRYNMHFVQALEAVTSHDEIVSVRASYLEKIEEHAGEDKWYLQPERCGGGCVADNGPNVFDTLAYFLGHLTVRSADIVRNERNVDLEARIRLESDTGIPAEVHLDWNYPYGEKKDVHIVLKDGREIAIDMLAGFTAFKSSLYHEYEAILHDFAANIAMGGCHGEDGYDAVRLVHDTYRAEAVSA
ncbi:gfo/Idh/MocA family oxidoreductase [Xylanibacillus composti]|uniref:Gfo/Idh/MocA family oxidoreductase n=1 Tax=Xylanibacillus composti TaxID=1572762 RepID=A0A8J4M1G6_9BACL|nr:Gfo/Idh/MocA family oxidoreductase [Xylanibacillus composti]MDT9726199.1 gfo/Idh/MocA family oxidoreductase [Xylanibacillus composti]GIQ68045.1 Gfo/Idh/MocA family oxidoreductase [Xylanibacillus composti]